MTGCVGLDLSLRATGIAHVDGHVEVVRTGHLRGMTRLHVVRSHVSDALAQEPQLVAIEGYAFGAHGRAVISLGELGGLVRYETWRRDIRYVEVTPLQLKKYATGYARGVSKTAMVIAARDRLGYEGESDDEADALWLRALALDVLGEPLAVMPVANRLVVSRLGTELRRAEQQPKLL